MADSKNHGGLGLFWGMAAVIGPIIWVNSAQTHHVQQQPVKMPHRVTTPRVVVPIPQRHARLRVRRFPDLHTWLRLRVWRFPELQPRTFIELRVATTA